MTLKKLWIATGMSLVIGAGCATAAAPFGGEDDTAYADRLWQAMAQSNLVGDGALMSSPYTGQHPHGAVLDTIYTSLRVGGNEDTLIVKRNYGGEGVSKQAVANDPGSYLKAVTVMYKRPGYDPDNSNWFWAKYLPDGSLDTNPKGMKLAGKVAKGMPKGCIACHSGAPGGDMVFTSDRY